MASVSVAESSASPSSDPVDHGIIVSRRINFHRPWLAFAGGAIGQRVPCASEKRAHGSLPDCLGWNVAIMARMRMAPASGLGRSSVAVAEALAPFEQPTAWIGRP